MRPVSTALPAFLLIAALAGCGSHGAPAAAGSPYQTPTGPPPPVTTATPPAASTAPYFPPGPVCQAYDLDLAIWQQAGAENEATLATFTKFARELRIEARLAADDQPLGADLSVAAKAVYDAGKTGAAGGQVNTSALADDLENVKLDCASP